MAEIIHLKARLSEGNGKTEGKRRKQACLEDMKHKMLENLDLMTINCGVALAHCDSDVIRTARMTIQKMHFAINSLPVTSPAAPKIYTDIAELTERLGDLLSAELRAQAQALPS